MENLSAIKNQIEFYFSDANLRMDSFLKTEMKKNEGWIDASVLLTFNKLKQLNATVENIQKALEGSGSTVVDIKTEEEKVYLKKIETEEYKNYLNDKNIENRILYIKGLDSSMSLEELNEYLSKHFEIVFLRMIRNKEKKFTGAIFVELKNDDDVEKVLKMKIPVFENDETIKKRKTDGKEGISNFLLIKKKVDFVTDNKNKRDAEKIESKRKTILDDFKGKFYKYESNKESDIKEIKGLIEGVAFVDKINRVLRFKNIMEFEEKEFEKEDLKVKIKKLDEKETGDYTVNIKFGTLSEIKKNKRNKRKN